MQLKKYTVFTAQCVQKTMVLLRFVLAINATKYKLEESQSHLGF